MRFLLFFVQVLFPLHNNYDFDWNGKEGVRIRTVELRSRTNHEKKSSLLMIIVIITIIMGVGYGIGWIYMQSRGCIIIFCKLL